PVALVVAEATEQAVPAQALQGQADRLILRTSLEACSGDVVKAFQQQATAPLQRRHLERPVDATDLRAEQGRRGRLVGAQITAAESRRQGGAAQGVADPVRYLAALLVDEGGDGRQVVAGIVGDGVVLV